MPQTSIPALGQQHIAEHSREQEITGITALSCKFRSVRPQTHYLTGASICHEVMSNFKHAKQDALDRAVQLPEFNPTLTMITCRPGPGVCSLKIMWLYLQSGFICGERVLHVVNCVLVSPHRFPHSKVWCEMQGVLNPWLFLNTVSALETPEFSPPQPGQHSATQHALLPYAKTTTLSVLNTPVAEVSHRFVDIVHTTYNRLTG